jgi:predicted alpha/beta superfamily hydrolase
MYKKTTAALIFLLAFSRLTLGQAVAVISPEQIIIDSKILNEKCKAFVSLPENYHSATTEKYPVVYVLDGEYYLSFTADAAVLLAQSGLAPNCIIIGITTNNRDRDFSPGVDADAGQNQGSPIGGADKFLEYLKTELIPAVNEKYRTLPYRVMIGHSTGGLLAYYSLYKTPDLSQAIISIDGSTWWNKGKVGRELIAYLKDHPDYKGKIYECRKDIRIPVRFPANTELLNYLDKQRPQGLNYTYLELPNESHGTIVFPGTYYGLKGIFADYKKL